MKVLLSFVLLLSTTLAAETLTVWVSDEQCAAGRAKDGVFTGTNPDCAKRCVGEGKKIVLVSESQKKLFQVANPELLKNEVGNLVEVAGEVNGDTVKIDSVKHLQEGAAMCARAKKK
jgi:hypothetical protein